MQTSAAVHDRVEPDRDTERLAGRAAARRFAVASTVGGMVALAVFVWFVNLGRSNLFQRPIFGQFYDVQARSLLHGHLNVPGAGLGYEGIVVHGRTYEYYGPFPALLRIPVLLVTHRLDGRLSQVSMSLAFAVALFGGARLLWRARTLLRADAPMTPGEAVVVGTWTFALGTASALLFPASRAIVYHEAELWGAALALVGLDAVIGAALRPSWSRLLVAAALSTCALLARASVGLAPAVALGVLALIAFATPMLRSGLGTPRRSRLLRGARDALGYTVAALVPVVIYALVNHAKFGNWLSVPFDKQVFSRLDANRIAVLQSNGGSLFSPKYVPSTLLQYIRPDALRLTHLFPFLDFRVTRPRVLLHVRFDTLDRTSSIVATMPVFVVLAIFGVYAACRRSLGSVATRVMIALVVGSAVAVVPTLAIGFIANRYLIDFVPLLLVGAAFGLQVLARGLDGRRAAGYPRSRLYAAGVVLAALVVFAVWVNTATTLTYQRLYAAPSTGVRRGFVGFQESVGDALGTAGYGVVRVGSLPRRMHADRVAIVGRCAGLYWSDPRASWQPLELGPAGTRVRSELHLVPAPSRRVVLVSVGRGSDVLSVTVRGTTARRLVFGIVDADGRVVEGPPVQVAPGAHVLDASLDRELRREDVTLDGRAVVGSASTVPPGAATIANPPPGAESGPVTAIRSLPVTTPLCDRVSRR